MSTERAQSLANHTQYTPFYHFFAAPLGIAYFVWAVRRLVANPTVDSWFVLLGALAVVAAIAVSRTQVLRVQDRVIRLEERLRLLQILPADLQTQVTRLRPSHLVALRFASDEEAPGLMREILANPAMSQKEIKGRIRNWRADWFRA